MGGHMGGMSEGDRLGEKIDRQIELVQELYRVLQCLVSGILEREYEWKCWELSLEIRLAVVETNMSTIE